MTSSHVTIDHAAIRQWVEEREGVPSKVKDTGEGGILRIDFGEPEEELEPLPWNVFFAVFEDRDLAFLYQERTSEGGLSRFNKFVQRP